ncbi:protein-glutamate O-methyltransferase CheR [bacterium]|nr:protein-glutamate O-methyltransferase CheR [bacterium]
MIYENQHQFDALLQLVLKEKGLDCRQYKISYLKRRLKVRLRATQRTTYQAYQELLEQDTEEYDRLLDRLTINVSQFYRDPSVYRQIKQVVLPAWRQRSGVRIWSAGCANGEEPYSLAMLLREELSHNCQVRILATDIDPICLQRARKGVYKASALSTLPTKFKLRNFHQENDTWMIKSELQRRIDFQRHDLTNKLPGGPFDLIICRNVMIYFVRALQERLFREFHRRLAPGGFLILGKTETLLGEMRDKYINLDIRERIYQRKETDL